MKGRQNREFFEDRQNVGVRRLPLPRSMKQLFPLVFIVLLFVVMNRQQRKRAQAGTALQNSIATGDEVVTTSGIYGVVRAIADDQVQLEIADHVVVRIAKGAIARKTQDRAQGILPEVTQ